MSLRPLLPLCFFLALTWLSPLVAAKSEWSVVLSGHALDASARLLDPARTGTFATPTRVGKGLVKIRTIQGVTLTLWDDGRLMALGSYDTLVPGSDGTAKLTLIKDNVADFETADLGGNLFSPILNVYLLTFSGEVWGWGNNTYRQLGNAVASSTTRNAPWSRLATSVAKLRPSRFVGLFYITRQGQLYLLGEGELAYTLAPELRAPLRLGTPSLLTTDVEDVVGGGFNVLILKTDHTVSALGESPYDVAFGTEQRRFPTPTVIHRNVSRVWLSGIPTFTLRDPRYFFEGLDGTIWITSYPYNLANLVEPASNTKPQVVPLPLPAKEIFPHSEGAHFLLTDNSLWAIGDDDSRGDGEKKPGAKVIPTKVATGVIAFSAPSRWSKENYTSNKFLIKEDGSVWGWGRNRNGSLGIGSTTATTKPIALGISAASVIQAQNPDLLCTYFRQTDGTILAAGVVGLGGAFNGAVPTFQPAVQVPFPELVAPADWFALERYAKAQKFPSHTGEIYSFWYAGSDALALPKATGMRGRDAYPLDNDYPTYYLGANGALYRILNGSTGETRTLATGVTDFYPATGGVFFRKGGTDLWAVRTDSYSSMVGVPNATYLTPTLVRSDVVEVLTHDSGIGFVTQNREFWFAEIPNLYDVSAPFQRVATGVQEALMKARIVYLLNQSGTLTAFGQTQQGTAVGSATAPVTVADQVKSFVAEPGYLGGLMVRQDGRLDLFGSNNLTPFSPTGSVSQTPTTVATGVRSLAAFSTHTFTDDQKALTSLGDEYVSSSKSIAFIKTDGSLWGYGENVFGELGLGHNQRVPKITQLTPTAVQQARFVRPSVKDPLSLRVLGSDGTLWTSGGLYGQGAKPVPSSVSFRKVASGIEKLVGDLAVRPRGKAVNLSVRGPAGTGDRTLIGGFVIEGKGKKKVLIRVSGPSLVQFGVNAVADPRLTLYSSSGQVIATNDNWSTELADSFRTAGAFEWTAGSKDAAIQIDLDANQSYTVAVGGGDAEGSKEALLEIYDVSKGTESELSNVSCRVRQSPQPPVIILGMVLDHVNDLLIRNAGPSLKTFGVSTAATNTKITAYGANGSLLGTNDDWDVMDNGLFKSMGAFDFGDSIKDAAMRLASAPTQLTLHCQTIGEPGIGLCEVYILP